MSLKLPPAPEATAQVVSSALRRAHASGRFALSAGATGGAAAVTPVAPHQVYAIGLDQLTQGRGLEAAQPVGWRTIILQGKTPVAAVEFNGGGAGQRDFRTVNQGPFVQSTAAAISVAESLPQVRGADYEPRLLQMPAIQLLSLWLHSQTENLFIPLAPAPGDFKPYTLYSERDFFDLAATLAARRAASDDRPKGKPPTSGPQR